ncbi:transcriptional regulator, putative [Heliomicrobium modesticaldum Ice1]|uniref:Transcriptional regulator, putative n=1 Tax=Heliobacterium modesticaldum (strain ATCC 51547 / Ice1) TaxID=498761 RepID=B0TGV5_HELMI|nr:transcription factor FapR [Heliomicrobium modesticaldum]ABZ84716.1 transcriptional regulator, putative [Heliomicrobium modesticaldum Ice1]
MGGREKKEARLAALEQIVQENPFYTDGELARRLGVSIQTIRLDRQQIGIPEVRERTRQVAAEKLKEARSISSEVIVGELTHLQLGREAESRLLVTEAMLLQHSTIARGHYLFAQANSLAVAVVDASVAVTGLSRVRYRRPVRLGETVVARAQVVRVVGARNIIRIVSTVNDEVVFSGKFYVTARDKIAGT